MENTEIKKSALDVHVLIMASKRTGVVDKVITAMGAALLKMWAMSNTTKKTQVCYIFNRETGKMVFACEGTGDFPYAVDKITGKSIPDDVPSALNIDTCEDIGISLADLHDIKDERFDK